MNVLHRISTVFVILVSSILFNASWASMPPPIADTGGPYFGIVDEPVTFDAAGEQGPNLTYTWDFGDGDSVTVPESSTTHTYFTAGTFNVILTVTDTYGNGSTDSTTATISPANQPPDCSGASPSTQRLWPPNHGFVPVYVLGVTDPDGDPVTTTIDSIFQDEPVSGPGSGKTAPDGAGVGTSIAEIRAERNGGSNGRTYHITFTSDDGISGTCSGDVSVCVPHDQSGTPCIDEGPIYDSTDD